MHTLQDSGNEGHRVGQLFDCFAALSHSQKCPPPLRDDLLARHPAPLVNPSVTLCVDQPSEGEFAQVYLCDLRMPKHLGVAPQTPESVPYDTTLMLPSSGMSSVWTDHVVEMMLSSVCANETLTGTQIRTNAANSTLETFVHHLKWDVVNVEGGFWTVL